MVLLAQLTAALAAREGPLFWGAAALVALLASVLATGLLLVARRLRARSPRFTRRPEALRAYQAQAPAPAPDPAAAVEPAPPGVARLAPLLDRLRAASARLEELAAAGESPDWPADRETGLKGGAEEVEYLHRVSV